MACWMRNRPVVLVNQPFAGPLGVKVYAGLGSPNAIRYRPEKSWMRNAVPVQPTFENDVSIATALSPAEEVTFEAPEAWYGRDDIWIQLRTFENGYECEVISGPQLLKLDDDGDSLAVLAGTCVILGFVRSTGGAGAVTFTWVPDPQCVALTSFAAVRTAGPSSPSAFLGAVSSARLQRITLSGLLVGTYTFRLEARAGANVLVLGTFTATIPATPESTITISFEEDKTP